MNKDKTFIAASSPADHQPPTKLTTNPFVIVRSGYWEFSPQGKNVQCQTNNAQCSRESFGNRQLTRNPDFFHLFIAH
jgi:hypothetical protein